VDVVKAENGPITACFSTIMPLGRLVIKIIWINFARGRF